MKAKKIPLMKHTAPKVHHDHSKNENEPLNKPHQHKKKPNHTSLPKMNHPHPGNKRALKSLKPMKKSVRNVGNKKKSRNFKIGKDKIWQNSMSKRKESDQVYISLGYRSMAGMTEGISKLNQDAYFHDTLLLNNPHMSLIACFDGHGMEGHRCSNYLKSNLPSKFEFILDSNPLFRNIQKRL